MDVFVLRNEGGQYSDKWDYIVGVYKTRELAKEVADKQIAEKEAENDTRQQISFSDWLLDGESEYREADNYDQETFVVDPFQVRESAE